MLVIIGKYAKRTMGVTGRFEVAYSHARKQKEKGRGVSPAPPMSLCTDAATWKSHNRAEEAAGELPLDALLEPEIRRDLGPGHVSGLRRAGTTCEQHKEGSLPVDDDGASITGGRGVRHVSL